MTIWGILLIVLLALAAVCLLCSAALLRYGVCRKLPKYVPGMKKSKPEDASVPWSAYLDESRRELAWFDAQGPETLTLTSFDGLKLYADYLPCSGSDQTVLLINGYRSLGGKSDFPNVLRRYRELGYNLLTCEQRAHGRSEGSYIGFGVPERLDVRDWARLLVEKFAPRTIILHGISMGCATVLMATGTELPKQVKAIIADCGYTSPWEICAYQLKKQSHLPVFPILYLTNWLDKLLSGYSLREYSCREALKTNKIPVLFIHGGKDDFVPTRMGRENYESCLAEKKWLCAEEAGHGMSLWVEKERMLGEIEAFIRDR